MSTHALFPPSAAERWMTCTGSFALGLQVPEPPSSEYAEEGTRLHDVAAGHLTGGYNDPVWKTTEDYAAIKPYLDYAAKVRKTAVWTAVEDWIGHSAFLSGTPDLLALYPAKINMLEVVDLKNGAGILVDPVENKQMLTYGYIAIHDMEKQSRPVPRNVRLTVVQPPDEKRPVKSWDTTIERVKEHGAAAEAAIKTALAGEGELVPGDHCRFCKAKAICPKLRGEVVEALAGAAPLTMTPPQLAVWLDRADRMEGFIKNLREVAHDVASVAAAQHKDGIPGWVLKPKRATRSWADEDAVLAFARQRKIKIYQDKLLSPAMAEKEHPNLPKELRDQIVAVSSGVNLVRGNAPKVLEPEGATKTERLKANIALMQHRR